MKFDLRATTLVATLIALTLSTGLAIAHGGATGIVKERMDLMASVGKSMKTITQMLQGARPFDAAELRTAAQSIGTHGGEQMTRLFPDGSIQSPSEALPAIWQDWDRFSALANELTVFANALAEAAENPRGHGMGRGGPGQEGGGSPMARRNPMMGGATGSPMMERGAGTPMNDPAALARMAPDAAFARLTQTCSACHTKFRKKQ